MARATQSGPFGGLFTAWLAATGALLLAALLVGIDATRGVTLSQAAADPGDTIDLEFPAVDEYRSVTYGSIQWTLVETRMIPRERQSFSRPVIIMDMLARNIDDTYQARARRRDMVLILDDGTRATMDRFEHTPSTYRIAIDPGEEVPVTLVFKPPVARDPWLDGVVLEIAEDHRHPALLPLTDSATGPDVARFPHPTEIEPGEGDVVVGQSTVDIDVVEATIDLNAGPYRARTDEQLVVVEVSVDDPRPPAGATGIAAWSTRDFWQLELDLPPTDHPNAGPLSPYHVSSLPSGGDGLGPVLVELVFTIPADVEPTTMSLTAGAARVNIGTIRPSRVGNQINR